MQVRGQGHVDVFAYSCQTFGTGRQSGFSMSRVVHYTVATAVNKPTSGYLLPRGRPIRYLLTWHSFAIATLLAEDQEL